MTWEQVFGITMNHGYIIEIILAEFLFFFHFERRNMFWFRFLVGLPVFVFLAIVLPNLVAYLTPGFFSLIIFLLSLVLLKFLFSNPFSYLLFCSISAQLIQNMSYNIECCLYYPFQESFNLVGRFFLTSGCLLLVYGLSYFFLVRRMGKAAIKGVYVYVMAIVTALFVYLMQFLLTVYGLDTYFVARLPLLVCCVFGLAVQFGFLSIRTSKEENEKLEILLERDARQYRQMAENAELISLKAHDLKHFLDAEKGGGVLDEEREDIREALESFEADSDYGNGPLNVVLQEKKRICRENGIEFLVMADGKECSFLKPTDLIALVSNALDNAIEYEKKMEKGKRTILLTLSRKKDMLLFHVENYCPEKISFVDGLPLTTKEDSRYHGFGLRSIRYVALKYHGMMNVETDGNLFTLDVLLPIPSRQNLPK